MPSQACSPIVSSVPNDIRSKIVDAELCGNSMPHSCARVQVTNPTPNRTRAISDRCRVGTRSRRQSEGDISRRDIDGDRGPRSFRQRAGLSRVQRWCTEWGGRQRRPSRSRCAWPDSRPAPIKGLFRVGWERLYVAGEVVSRVFRAVPKSLLNPRLGARQGQKVEVS